MGKRRSHSAAEAAAGVRGGAVAELPAVEVAVGVGARAHRVRAPAASGCGETAALGAVHARELEPRVDAREVHTPHAAADGAARFANVITNSGSKEPS